MIFEQSPKTYKRISQGLIILATVSALKVGWGLIERNYNPLKKQLPLTAAASGLSLIYNVQYKRSKNKSGEENNDSKWLEKSIETI